MRYTVIAAAGVIDGEGLFLIVDTEPEPGNPSATPMAIARATSPIATAIAAALNASIE